MELFRKFKIGRIVLKPSKPLIAGILNVTPDSFSDGGKNFKKSTAVKYAFEMEEEGADILDIGGESSRPGAKMISVKDEMQRVIPVIRAIRKKSSIPISIDTYKPEVAKAAIDEGADMINDITGFADAKMAELAAKTKKPVILMHMKGNPRTMQKNPRYKNVTREIISFLKKNARNLEKHGVKNVIIDPGIGFGKSVKQNLELLTNIKKFSELGYPLMVGASKKSFIGKISGADVDKRLGGTLSVHIFSILNGASIIRVHDIAPHRQAIDVAMKMVYGK